MSRAGVVSLILEFSSTRCPGTAPSWKQSYGVYLSQRTVTWRVWYKVGIARWQSVFVVLWMRNAPYRRPRHLNIWSLAGGVAWGRLGCTALLDQDRYCEQETLQLHAASSSFLPCGCGWGCELCSSHHTWWTLSPSGTIAKINLFFPCKLLRATVFLSLQHWSRECSDRDWGPEDDSVGVPSLRIPVPVHQLLPYQVHLQRKE